MLRFTWGVAFWAYYESDDNTTEDPMKDPNEQHYPITPWRQDTQTMDPRETVCRLDAAFFKQFLDREQGGQEG